ncbi:MAG: phage tail tube protein [Candidatus Margulisiibacteriota bacterium]
MRSGNEGQLKFAIEDAWADGKTPSISVPTLKSTIKPDVEMAPRDGEGCASRYAPTPRAGKQWTPGGWEFNAYPDILGYFLLVAYGTPSTTQINPGVYSNVFQPGVVSDQSMSLEDSKGGENPLMVPGYKIKKLNFSQAMAGAAQFLIFGCDGGGKFGTEGSLTTFTYPSTFPLIFSEAAMTIAGAAAYLDSVQWTEDNGLVVPNHKVGAGGETIEPDVSGNYKGEGSFVLDFEDLSNWDKFRLATDVAIAITYTSSQLIAGADPYKLTVTMPVVRFKNPLPDRSGSAQLKETVGFEMFAGDVDGANVPISYTLQSSIDYSAL